MHVVSATTGRDCSISQATVAEVKALALFVEPDAIAFDQKFALGSVVPSAGRSASQEHCTNMQYPLR